MGLSENINALLYKYDITAETLAKVANVSQSTVSRWRHGGSIRSKKVDELCEYFDLVPDDILSDNNGLASKEFGGLADEGYTEVPVYGAIAAGTPIDIIDVEGTFPIPRKLREKFPHAFLLKVEGESMNIDFKDGSYVLVDPCDTVEHNGQPYAIAVNGDTTTVKRVKKLGNGFELMPNSTDPTYRSVVYDYGIEGTETITVIGRVVWDVKPMSWTY